jgi:hypothetical protein
MMNLHIIFKKSKVLILITLYLVINIIFCYKPFWSQLFFDSSTNGSTNGELQVFEWTSETVYKQILNKQNPFGNPKTILYPFGITLANLEPGFGLWFVFLRPFLSPHQSISVIIPMNLLLSNIGMFLLLKKLKIHTLPAFLFGLSYGYTTYLMPRLGGHVTYTAIYFFPWFYYFCLNILFGKTRLTRMAGALGTGIIFCLTAFTNLYFFILLLIGTASYSIYLFFNDMRGFIKQIINSWHYILISLLTISILMAPWVIAVGELLIFSGKSTVVGWAGAIEFSSDLFGFLIPSQYGKYYGKYLGILTKNLEFTHGIFENFSYPGIINILGLGAYVLGFKKFSKYFKDKVKPFFYLGLIFFLLTLGPFLHVAGRWSLDVEGIKIVFPLPFIIMHYLPFLNNIRAPGRLVIGFIFFSTIISAHVINYLQNNISRYKFYIIYLLLVIIVVVDQRFQDNYETGEVYYPTKIYHSIAKDDNFSSVLNIPFVVRDGFTYFGNYNAVTISTGQHIQNKPIIGGYFGRIPDYYKGYYSENPLLGYFGRKIDIWKDLNINPNDDIFDWEELDLVAAKDTQSFLDIKYVILNEAIENAVVIEKELSSLDYYKVLQDRSYSLWISDYIDKEYLEIDFSQASSRMLLGRGWYYHESEDYRWAKKRSSVMFKILHDRPMKIKILASSIDGDQTVKVFVNKNSIGTIRLTSNPTLHELDFNDHLLLGLNSVSFFAERDQKPSQIFPNNQDNRDLAIRFYKILLEDGQVNVN